MGIPRLLQRFKDAGHATTETIGDTAETNPVQKTAIIDGPSLAHSIARSVKHDYSQRPSPDVGTPPLYAEIAHQIVVWLDRLCLLGFTINAIFFDGALPDHKKHVRLERLTSYATNLDAYKSLHDAASRSFTIQRNNEIWQAPALETARRNLAPDPFLVSAAFEGLLESQYANKVQLVPGEADAFCVVAAHALYQENELVNPLIFTSDSDLIVFDSGPRTKIVYLHSLDLTENDGNLVLTADTVQPYAVANRLELANLVELACWMEQDPHRTLQDAVSHVKAGDPLGPGFDAFKSQYDTASEATTLTMLRRNPPVRSSRLNRLDARTAELIHQLPTTSPHIDSFLPFLFEDPSKTSTFRNIGQQYRQLAYSILITSRPINHPLPSTPTSIHEHHRSTTTITPIPLPILETSQKQTLHKTLLTHHTPTQWTQELLLLTLRAMIEADIPIPLPSTLTSPSPTTWEQIHFQAAIQATWYSLRILLQILYWCAAFNAKRRDFRALIDKLRDLPSTLEVFGRERERVSGEDVERIMGILEGEYGEFRRVKEVVVGEKRGRKEKKERRKRRRLEGKKEEEEEEEGGSRNMFALLAQQQDDE